MILKLPQPDLLAAINRVRGVVLGKTTIPVLTFLKLEAAGDELAITATDLGMLATARVSAAIETDGDVLIESNKFYDFVRRIPADREISIESDDNCTTIKAGRSRAKLATLPVGDFPIPDRKIDGAAFTLTAEQVKHTLFGPLPAASDEETRYYLCGVHIHTEDDELIGVATDGHKLIKKVVDAPEGCSLQTSTIIPTKPISVLQKCMADDDIEVEVGSNAIRFSTSSFVIHSNLVNGTFPDYQRVIPAERENPVMVDRAEAIAVIERVASVTADELKTLVFEHADDGIAVRTSKSAEAEAADIILAQTNGEFPYVGFATKKVAALLGSMESDQVVIHFSDTGAPHIFADPDRPSDIHVLMPVRV